MNKIKIPLSNTKLLLGIGGSILFVALGFWILLSQADQHIRQNPIYLKFIGISAILFFGATGIYGIKKMFENRFGLIIDDNGILDNTNASSVGLIYWKDIQEIKTEQVMSTKFLLIFTNNPETYLEKVKGMKKILLISNLKMYGTPFSITSNTLRYDFQKLEKLINDKFHEFKNIIPNN